jgi:hypothetical protein
MRKHLIEVMKLRLHRVEAELSHQAGLLFLGRRRFLTKARELLITFIHDPELRGTPNSLFGLLMYFIDDRFSGLQIHLEEDGNYLMIQSSSLDQGEGLMIQFLINQFWQSVETLPNMNLRELVTKLLYVD